jgi:hypothetical protein
MLLTHTHMTSVVESWRQTVKVLIDENERWEQEDFKSSDKNNHPEKALRKYSTLWLLSQHDGSTKAHQCDKPQTVRAMIPSGPDLSVRDRCTGSCKGYQKTCQHTRKARRATRNTAGRTPSPNRHKAS